MISKCLCLVPVPSKVLGNSESIGTIQNDVIRYNLINIKYNLDGRVHFKGKQNLTTFQALVSIIEEGLEGFLTYLSVRINKTRQPASEPNWLN